MEMKNLLKQTVKIFPVLIMLAIGIICIAKTDIYAAGDIQYQEVQTVLEQYFDDLFATLLEESDMDYSSNDFASINGYIIAKNLVSTRNTYNKLLGGIHAVDMEEITIDDLSNQGNNLEAMVYVKYMFSYGDNEECETGSLYRVTLQMSGEQYKVIDLDNTSVETQMVKDALNHKATRSAIDNYSMVDSYFQEIQKNADSLLEMPEIKEIEVIKEEECETASVSVSYNTTKARNYGYKLGGKYNNYIFKRASLDCTNFVSQCV